MTTYIYKERKKIPLKIRQIQNITVLKKCLVELLYRIWHHSIQRHLKLVYILYIYYILYTIYVYIYLFITYIYVYAKLVKSLKVTYDTHTECLNRIEVGWAQSCSHVPKCMNHHGAAVRSVIAERARDFLFGYIYIYI